jgi:hypothetical protein
MGDIIFKWYCDGGIVVSKGDNYNTMETIMLYFFIARTNYLPTFPNHSYTPVVLISECTIHKEDNTK